MATLHFTAGKAGAGKTTLARRVARAEGALVICEDEWMARLAEPIETLQQYLAAAGRIRSVIAPLAGDLLRLGVSVVFDFAGNTPRDRAWVRAIADTAHADLRLYYLEVDDDTALERVRQRNQERPEGLFFGEVTDQQIAEANRYFVPPQNAEGFIVVRY